MFQTGFKSSISEELWGVTWNNHCCGTFIQIKWILFPIVIHWYSVMISYLPWFRRIFSVLKFRAKVACVPDVAIPDAIDSCNKTASFRKEAMLTQVALRFFMKWNLYRNVPLCLSKQNVWTHKLRKVYCFKRLWPERNDWTWLHLLIKDETCPLWHIIRPTSR